MSTTASIVQLLRQGASPKDDDAGFPRVHLDETTGVSFAFGMSLHVLRGDDAASDDQVIAAIRLFGVDRIDDVVERLEGVSFDAHAQAVFNAFESGDWAAFAGPARALLDRTNSYDIARWCIAVGYVGSATDSGLDDAEAEDLALFASHPELTSVSLLMLSMASDEKPERLADIVELAEHLHGWALVDVIERRAHYPELAGDHERDRRLLLRVMQNEDGMGMELAWPLASAIEFARFVDEVCESDDDIELRAAIAWTLSTIAEGGPFPSIEAFPGGLEMLGKWAASRPSVSTLPIERTAAAECRSALRDQPDVGELRDQLRRIALAGQADEDLLSRAASGDRDCQIIVSALGDVEGTADACRNMIANGDNGWFATNMMLRHPSPLDQPVLIERLLVSPAVQPVPAPERITQVFPRDEEATSAMMFLQQLRLHCDLDDPRIATVVDKAIQARHPEVRSGARRLLVRYGGAVSDDGAAALRHSLRLDERTDDQVKAALIACGRASLIERLRWRAAAKRWNEHEVRQNV